MMMSEDKRHDSRWPRFNLQMIAACVHIAAAVLVWD
jgi:hypothetical protein